MKNNRRRPPAHFLEGLKLYENSAGGLYIFREGAETGFYMTGDVIGDITGTLFKNDARDIAGEHTSTWRIDLPRTTCAQAQRVDAVHVAAWETGEVTVHNLPRSAARRYLGRRYLGV